MLSAKTACPCIPMNRRILVFGFAVLLPVLAITALAEAQADGSSRPGFPGVAMTKDDIALGQKLYTRNCASCHGAKLEGQPNWKRRLPSGRMPAPPHDETGHTWHHSDRELFTMTKLGVEAIQPGYPSDMPGFAELLTDTEIRKILAFIKSTWPERQRAAQARLNESDKSRATRERPLSTRRREP